MKVGDLVNVTEQRGSGTFYNEIKLGYGVILEIKKTDDITIGSIGPVNLGDDVAVYLGSSGEVQHFMDKSIEVINESR
jgi:hypothetical protein